MKKVLACNLALTSLFAFSALAANPMLDVSTNLGDFTIELYQEKAPKTVENFLRYVENGSYEGSQFHRVIPGFVVQGGGYDANFNPKETFSPIKNESTPEVKNLRGTLSMARTQHPDSATRQFFINLVDNAFLDATKDKAGYAVFGEVKSGFETLMKVAKSQTQMHPTLGMRDVPVTPIVIEKISLQK